MRGDKSWKKERKICGVGQDDWGLTHKSHESIMLCVCETAGVGLYKEQPFSLVLPQTCSANLDLTFNGIFLTWDNQSLFEVLRHSAVMMNITEKPVLHRYELKLPSVLYKQLLHKPWFKMGPFLTKWIQNKHKKSSAFWAYGYVCKVQNAPN